MVNTDDIKMRGCVGCVCDTKTKPEMKTTEFHLKMCKLGGGKTLFSHKGWRSGTSRAG